MTHTVITDTIVRVSGQGWTYSKARLLIDSVGNGAIFTTKGSPPERVFTVDRTPRQALKGTGTYQTAEGPTPVSYTRIGSSCGYALAKCNVKTKVLAAAWDSYDRAQQDTDQEPARADD